MENKKLKNRCEKFFDEIASVLDFLLSYFIFPILTIVLLLNVSVANSDNVVGEVYTIALGVFTIIWIGVVTYRLIKKVIKLKVIWPLIVAIVCIIISLILGDDNKSSRTISIIAVLFVEAYLIYAIVNEAYDNSPNINKIIICSMVFITIGAFAIYLGTYNNDDKTLFNALVTCFSAILGGGLTLGGVAWTIKRSGDEKKEDEINRLKPLVFVVDPERSGLKDVVNIPFNECFINCCNGEGDGYTLKHFIIENADYSFSSCKGICINNNLFMVKIPQCFRKNTMYDFTFNDLKFSYKDVIKEVSLLLSDMHNNYYVLKFNFRIYDTKEENLQTIQILSGIGTVPVSVDFSKNIVKEYK